MSIEYLDKTVSPFIRGILYGEMGSWKTVTACSISEGNVVLLTADDGWVSLKNHPEIFGRTRIVPYQGLAQLSLIAESEPPDLLVVDTVSQIQEQYVDFLMDNVTWGGNYREKSIPKQGSKAKAEEIPSMPDYHLTRNKLRIPLRKILKMQCDVIFTCHVREPSFLEAQKGKLLRRPSLTQKLYEFVGREAHFVGFMEKRSNKNEATITFKTDPKTAAKSRIDLLSDKTINATELQSIVRKWKENV